MSKKSQWLNTTIVRYPDIEKPCVKLQYCPYGELVEEFPINYDAEHNIYDKKSCAYVNNNGFWQWGHDCPVHYHAELVEGE